MSDDLLSSATSTPEAVPATPVATEPSVLDQLVGEGKKFKTVEDLARGKIEADEFIAQTTFENKNMRVELDELASLRENSLTIKDVLDKLDANNQQGEPVQTTTEAAKPEEIQSLISEALTRERTKEQAQINRGKVNATIANYFSGDSEKATQHIRSQIENAGITGDQFENLAQTSPIAALRILNINEVTSERTNPSVTQRADINPDAPPVGGGKRNKAYYDALKKEMGFNKFHKDVKLQQQMHSDYATLGVDGWES